MKKMVFGKKFSRDTTSRRAMYRALVRSFVANRGMITTQAKARVILPMLEKLIQRAKVNSLQSRRAVVKFMGNDRVTVNKIYELADVLSSKKGGYLKYVNLPSRKGDNASMVKVLIVEKITEKVALSKGKKNDAKSETVVSGKKKSVSGLLKKLTRSKK